MATLLRPLKLIVALNLWVFILPAAAVDPPTDTQVDTQVDIQAREMFNSLMSPYCPGSLLSACPSGQAAVLRDSVRAQLRRGQSPEEIRQALVEIYGNEILASPPFQGLGTVTWLGVAVIFLGGFAAAAGWMRHRHRSALPAERVIPVAPGDLQRLRRELAEQDQD